MPSTFLETFGLSALESLSLGVPVAGFSKGGIVPFLLDDRLRLPEDSDFTSALEELFDVPDSDVDEWRLRSADVAAEFSKIAFRTRLVGLLPEGVSKILLVTDFVGNIGGIETYVSNLASTLEEFGYEVRTVGREGGFSSKTEKILSTLAAFANFPAKKELHAALEEFRPDAVWCHSVLRRYGAVGLDALSGLSAYKIMTYHDLGYFAPFAAECRQESDVPRPGFGNFIRSAHGFAAKLFAIAKYAKLRSLFARLRDFNLHLVPSDFLLSIVRDRLPDAKVVTLPHYVSFL